MSEKKPIKKRRNALGKGLGALLEDSITSDELLGQKKEVQPNSVAFIPLDNIESNPYQPRNEMDEEKLNELAESIEAQGIIQPITVRRLNEKTFQLISGHRRLAASKIAGLEEIPAYIRTANDEEMLEMALIENIQRENLNPIEIALGYQRLIDECNLIIEDVGKKVGKKRATVNNYLRLLKLQTQIQIGLREKKLSMGHARALVSLENKTQQLKAYYKVVDEGLSVRKTEELVKNLLESKKTIETSDVKNLTPYEIELRKIQSGLEKKFGTKVSINSKSGNKGEIKLSFFSKDDFERLLELLNE